jgi:hypothetical protein
LLCLLKPKKIIPKCCYRCCLLWCWPVLAEVLARTVLAVVLVPYLLWFWSRTF